MKTAIVAIAKDEDNYLKEWVDYNLKLGFDDIFVYQNNWRYSKNDIADPKVHLIEFDGQRMQTICYNGFIDEHYSEYDFVTMIDIDEFIYLSKNGSIKSYLADRTGQDCIYLNWRLFGDNGLTDVREGQMSVLRRFTRCDDRPNRLGKYIINLKRTGNRIRFENPHIVYFSKNPLRFPEFYDSDSNRINGLPWNIQTEQCKSAEIYHYRNKTYKECYERKFGKDDVIHDKNRCPWINDVNEFDRIYREHNKNIVKNISACNVLYPKWLILIVSTTDIPKDLYERDPKFNRGNFKIFNVSGNKIESGVLDVINSCEIDGYERLGYPYAESEVIYNIHKLNLFSEYEYIGLIHYDFVLFNGKNNTSNITENICRIINSGFDYISFQNKNAGYVLKSANIMLDERDRNCVFPQFSNVTNPKTCVDYILRHYNSVFHRKLKESQIDTTLNMNMCCSFLMRRSMFNELGILFESIIDEHYLDIFDEKKINRIPGNVMERALGIFSTQIKHYEFDLVHKNTTSHETLKNRTFLQKVRY